jgi:antitoxin (DNA-binding transcriptional repressor) of toxin-antitoxin stability system
MTRRIATAGARKNFASLVRRSAAGERIKLTRYNKTIAIVIPKKDLEALEDCEKQPDTEAEGKAEQPAAERPRRTRGKAKQTR